MNTLQIISEECTGCGICLGACPFGAISLSGDIAIIDYDKCTLCGACIASCAFGAIVLRHEEQPKAFGTPAKESYHDVWVYGEITPDGHLAPVVFELLNEGRRLADCRDSRLGVAIVGEGITELAKEAISRGADVVYLIDSPQYKDFIEERIATALEFAVRKFKPEIFLTGATVVGRSLIPRLAIKLETGLTADCTALDIDPETGNLLQTRPAFGGNIMATILCPEHRPQMATVRHKVFKEALPDSSRKGEIIEIDANEIAIGEFAKIIIERIDDSSGEELSVADADIIISGGRGIGGQDGFGLLYELAKTLGGAVGASRAAVDAGWIPYRNQVGQTGKTVAPKLYIACGISGAVQHKVGMQTSDFIVAINKDKSAPIFDIADIGIVGDVFEVLPPLIRALQNR
jgi:electron transfer flavoprotein alpha subunit